MPLASKLAFSTSVFMLLPIVARSAVIASSASSLSALRNPAAAAFALPLGLRAVATVPRISPALRGGNGAQQNILTSARQIRAQRMMNQMSMSSPADTSSDEKTAAELEWPANKVGHPQLEDRFRGSPSTDRSTDESMHQSICQFTELQCVIKMPRAFDFFPCLCTCEF